MTINAVVEKRERLLWQKNGMCDTISISEIKYLTILTTGIILFMLVYQPHKDKQNIELRSSAENFLTQKYLEKPKTKIHPRYSHPTEASHLYDIALCSKMQLETQFARPPRSFVSQPDINCTDWTSVNVKKREIADKQKSNEDIEADPIIRAMTKERKMDELKTICRLWFSNCCEPREYLLSIYFLHSWRGTFYEFEQIMPKSNIIYCVCCSPQC